MQPERVVEEYTKRKQAPQIARIDVFWPIRPGVVCTKPDNTAGRAEDGLSAVLYPPSNVAVARGGAKRPKTQCLPVFATRWRTLECFIRLGGQRTAYRPSSARPATSPSPAVVRNGRKRVFAIFRHQMAQIGRSEPAF